MPVLDAAPAKLLLLDGFVVDASLRKLHVPYLKYVVGAGKINTHLQKVEAITASHKEYSSPL